MKYKKVIIFLTLVLGAAVFGEAGAFMVDPHDTIAVWQEAQAAPDKREEEESGKIAVVNLDEGVEKDDGRVNYAEKLSRFPSMDFEYSSLEAARGGLETGRYGAYIIIPAVFSQNVESINAAPQVSQLEYAVNRSYSREHQYELIYNIQSYTDSLNDRLSYMYVDNILKEFHEAQDHADSVMENDLRDKAAIEKIGEQDLLALAELPDFQLEENPVEVPDISEYAKRNTMLAAAMEEDYTRSVQGIQAEADALRAGGMALSERLNSLSAQPLAPDITVDENGASIIEKADYDLRAELERQSKCMLEKEAAAQCLRKLLEDHQKLEEELDNSKEQPDEGLKEPEEQPGEGAGEPEGPKEESEGSEKPEEESDQFPVRNRMIAWLQEEERTIRGFLEEMETAKSLDIEKIIELVRTEYTEPLKTRAEETEKQFLKRQEEEVHAVASYNEQLAAFQPQMNDLSVSRSVQEMADNHTHMQDNLLKSSQAYMEYAQRSAESAREYAGEIRRKSDQTVADGLKEAQKVKKETSLANQKILGSFASKLPYTRAGKAENTLVYQFIVNPLTAEEQLEGQKKDIGLIRTEDEALDHLPERSLDQAVSGIPGKKKSSMGIVYAVAGTLAIVIIAQIYFFIRRRRYEY